MPRGTRQSVERDEYPAECDRKRRPPAESLLHTSPAKTTRERMLEPRVEGKDIVIEIDMQEKASPVALILGILAAVCLIVALTVMLTKVTELAVKSGLQDLTKGLGGLLDTIRQALDKAPVIMIPLLAIAGLLLLMLLLPKSVGAARSAFKKSES